MSPRKRRGRPPLGDKASTERIEIRVTRLERAAWEHAAAVAGVPLSEWIRQRCLMGAALARVEIDGKVIV
jgi:uncharacterized protein (DUF1778 family)